MRELLDSIAALPGVQDVAVHSRPAVRRAAGRRETFNVEGQPDPGPAADIAAASIVVGGDFFRALGMLDRSRDVDFDRQDTANARRSRSINETMARQFWPNEDAIGKRLRFYYDKNSQRWLSIVGIVRDRALPVRPIVDQSHRVFVPHQQHPFVRWRTRGAVRVAGRAHGQRSRPRSPPPCRRQSGPSTRISPS